MIQRQHSTVTISSLIQVSSRRELHCKQPPFVFFCSFLTVYCRDFYSDNHQTTTLSKKYTKYKKVSNILLSKKRVLSLCLASRHLKGIKTLTHTHTQCQEENNERENDKRRGKIVSFASWH